MTQNFSNSNFDFTIFYKTPLSTDWSWCKAHSWDVFLSAYNSSERVQRLYDTLQATEKRWLVFPEYGYENAQLPQGTCIVGAGKAEADVIPKMIADLSIDLSVGKICIDITGFIRPHLLFLLRWLHSHGVQRFDALYSEPGHYSKKEKTSFSKGGIREVRQVAGYEGIHSQDTSNNVLIVGSGYDSLSIKAVAESKNNARKVQVFGLPSLRADMYQENVIRAHQAEDALSSSESYFASAHDPFVTARVLGEIVQRCSRQSPVTNLYLSPLATKAQVLGFGLYYLAVCDRGPCSIIYPFSDRYERETTKGVSRVWRYEIELNTIRKWRETFV